MTISLLIGGARSGKSSKAEELAKQLEQNQNKQIVYVATYQPLSDQSDQEMQQRITHHQKQRPSHWQTIEASQDLADVINQHSKTNTCLLIDCLTLWLTHCLCSEDLSTQAGSFTRHERDTQGTQHTQEQSPLLLWQQQKQAFLAALSNASTQACDIILVSNEVGHGIVPMGELSRQFVDESGWLHQDIAKIADSVEFVMAGLSLPLKTPNQGEQS